MIDPERLIGAFVGAAVSGSSKGARRDEGFLSANKAAIGMGLLGLAVGAFEHFSQQQQGGQNAGLPHPGVPPAPRAAPPSPPPTPPAKAPEAPPVPGARVDDNAERKMQEALLVIRAMIAAACADGQLDEQERVVIEKRLAAANITAEEQALITTELNSPATVEALAAEAIRQGAAEQTYAASLLAITVDTEAERQYLQKLSAALGLSREAVERWHKSFGI